MTLYYNHKHYEKMLGDILPRVIHYVYARAMAAMAATAARLAAAAELLGVMAGLGAAAGVGAAAGIEAVANNEANCLGTRTVSTPKTKGPDAPH